MDTRQTIAGWKDKVLFTPGPLTTSRTVKTAMLRDLGSRDVEFIALVREIREKLVEIGQGVGGEYTAIPMQGSGTFALEAVVSSTVAAAGKLLVIVNGAYGKRIATIARRLKIQTAVLGFPENRPAEASQVDAALEADPEITHVAVVHCETTTGILNAIEEIGEVVTRRGATYFVDAMSSFGAVPIHLGDCGIDYLVSSANKCIEGVPGFAFVLARIGALQETRGYARSLSLDLLDQYEGLEKNGQFRFTPPTHALVAFRQALTELEAEGGVQGRARRYRANHQTLLGGMREIGFKEYLRPQDQGHIITSFLYPDEAAFDFEQFYARLNARGYVIYPGKVSDANCFRIGNIGRIFESDVRDLLGAIRQTIGEMGLTLP